MVYSFHLIRNEVGQDDAKILHCKEILDISNSVAMAITQSTCNYTYTEKKLFYLIYLCAMMRPNPVHMALVIQCYSATNWLEEVRLLKLLNFLMAIYGAVMSW